MNLTSFDNYSICYDIHGSGFPLFLLHGFSNDKSIWGKTGWVAALSKTNTVITVDLRGSGKSSRPISIDAYNIENFLDDIELISRHLQLDEFGIFGWSFGATIGTHYAKKRKVKFLIACGSYFNKIFTSAYITDRLIENDDPIIKIKWKALENWPIVNPDDIQCPYFIYTGSADGNIVLKIQSQTDEIIASGGSVKIYDNLNHYDLIASIENVFNDVFKFIKKNE